MQGAQESGSMEQICSFAEGKGAKWMMMDKVDVNGPKTSPVWKARPRTILIRRRGRTHALSTLHAVVVSRYLVRVSRCRSVSW